MDMVALGLFAMHVVRQRFVISKSWALSCHNLQMDVFVAAIPLFIYIDYGCMYVSSWFACSLGFGDS